MWELLTSPESTDIDRDLASRKAMQEFLEGVDALELTFSDVMVYDATFVDDLFDKS
jgi:phenylalanine-4-hydroxylase